MYDPWDEGPGTTVRDTKLRLHLSLAMLAAGAALLGAAAAHGRESASARNGGTFRIGFADDVPAIDPALTGPFTRGEIASLTCVTPMTYADRSVVRLVPEAATGIRVSRDGRTYTFPIRRGLRFNTGEAVTARTFVATIDRNLRSGGEVTHPLSDIVGAVDVLDGKADHAAGVRANGRRLAITLSEPAPDFPFRTTLSSFCAVPVGLPVDPEGVGAPFPAAGPYYVSSWTRGRRIVLSRNPRYGGRRPHHVAAYVVELNLDPREIVSRIERGTLDVGDIPGNAHARLGRRHGVNRSRYFVRSTPLIYSLVLNQRRGAFRSVRQRRAANFAVDRGGLVRTGSRVGAGPRFGSYWATPTDQWLTPGMPGYRAARIYPSRPNVKRARALVRTARGAKRVRIYTRNEEPFLSWAQVVQRDLRRAGLTVRVESFPLPVLFEKIDKPGEPWDVALLGGYGPDYPDPASTLAVFDGPPTPARYRRLLQRASRLRGAARYRAYGRLDVALARDLAPTVPFAALNLRTFVSRRVACKIFRPELDLAAVCLKR